MFVWQRKMRWFLTALLALTLLFAVTNCGDQENPITPDGSGESIDPFADVLYRDMVSVPGGTFTQEDTSSHSFDHTITTFQMAKYEVTYELWHTVHQWATANGYTFANAGNEGDSGSAGADTTAAKYEPVTEVNWRDCMVWCNAYSEMAGLSPVYKNGSSDVIKDSTNGAECDAAVPDWTADGYSLPTEGEWQYAASYQDGVSWTPYDWASGATADYTNAGACQAVANYDVPDPDETKDVGGYQANQLGIHDMSGNVYEWCWDWDGIWPGGPETDYRGPGSGSTRVTRGGAWLSPAINLQIGRRVSVLLPGDRDNDIGLRLVRR